MPVQLNGGKGEAFPDGTDGAGIAVQDVKVIGYADLDGNGTTDVLAEVTCSGSPAAMCCAGRGSILPFAVPLRLRDGRLEVIGSAITGAESTDNLYRLDDIQLVGGDIRTVQALVYLLDGGIEPEGSVTFSYHWDGTRWVETREG